jgi:hypothetical protein
MCIAIYRNGKSSGILEEIAMFYFKVEVIDKLATTLVMVSA